MQERKKGRNSHKKRNREERIDSYLYVAEVFCWQSASKDLFPCPLSLCQIVIKPSWNSKKPSTHLLWHQLFLFVSLSITQTHMHISSWKKQIKKKSLLFRGSPKTYHWTKWTTFSLSHFSSLTDVTLIANAMGKERAKDLEDREKMMRWF